MKTFYTILKISPNTVAGDLLSIGLLVCRRNEYWFRVSDHKKNIAKKLLGTKEKSVDFILKQLSLHLKNIVSTNKNNQFFPLESFITAEYIDYMNVYANGVMQFSKASFLDDDFNDEKFEKLYSLLIEKSQELEIPKFQVSKTEFFERVESKLIHKVENRIHTHINLNDDVLKSLYFNIEMDCIGMNGSFVGAKSLPMDLSVQSLKRNVSDYLALIVLLSQQYNKPLIDNNFFLIADEPNIKTPEHKFWEEMREVPSFKMIPSDEVEQVSDIVVKTGASKFLAAAE